MVQENTERITCNPLAFSSQCILTPAWQRKTVRNSCDISGKI